MKSLSILMLSVNIFIFLHSITVGHFQSLSYNFGWVCAIIAWAVIYFITIEYLKPDRIIMISKIFVGGSIGLLLYARFFSDILSYTEILGWMSSAGAWGIILFAGIGHIKIK
jgi:hypothetical protein